VSIKIESFVTTELGVSSDSCRLSLQPKSKKGF